MSLVHSVSCRMWIANMLIVVALLMSCIIPTAAIAVAPGAPRAQETDLAQRAADIAVRYGVDVQLILEMVEAGVPIEIIDSSIIDAYLSDSNGPTSSSSRQPSMAVAEEPPRPVTAEVDAATFESALQRVADASDGLGAILSEAHLRYAHSIDTFDIDAFLFQQAASINGSGREPELADAFRSAASDFGINPRVLFVLTKILSEESPAAAESGAIPHLFASTSSFHSSDGLPTEILQAASILNQEMNALKWDHLSQEVTAAHLDALTTLAVNPSSLTVYLLAALSGQSDWKERLLDPDHGFITVYTAMFADPLAWPAFLPTVAPSVSADWRFPYDKSEGVYYTGGPHIFGSPFTYTDTVSWVGFCKQMVRTDASAIDFAVGSNIHLLAIDTGRVVHSKYYQGVAANVVAIKHSSGIASYYIHMSGLNPNIRQGFYVPRGYYVGREGNANGQQPTHTHIELRMGGKDDWWGANSGVPVSWEGLTINGWTVGMHRVKGDEQKGYAYQGSIVSGTVASSRQEIKTTEWTDPKTQITYCPGRPLATALVGAGYPAVLNEESNVADQNTRFAGTDQAGRKGNPLVSSNEEKTEALPRSVDVALIIDSSGSMTSNDPRNLRKDAAKVFIGAMQDEDLVSVIDFDDGARTAWQLQRVGADRSGPMAAVNTINSSGGTNIGLGLQTGYSSLLTSTNGNAKAAVLLTDGQGDYNNQANLYKQKGWKVYTIGLGSGVNANLLKRIANETGGEYFALTDPEQLVKVYVEILGAVAEGTTVRSETIRLDPQQTKTVLANLPSGQTSANFLTTWQGSTVDTKLIAPDGSVITPDTPATNPNVAHFKGLTFELYRVTNPQAGDWQIEIYGADLPAGGEDVSVTVAVRGLEGYFNAYINAPTGVSCANPEFTAEAWVVNDTNTTFLTGTATISLPVGLTLASGQAPQQSFGVVLQGSQVKSEWFLAATTTGVTQTLPYTVVTTFEQGPTDPMVALGAVQIPQCTLSPATAALSATPNKIVANGISTSTITVVFQDIAGVRVPNATASFATTLGAITNAATTGADGSASVTLRSATTTGMATITAAAMPAVAGSPIAVTQVEFIPGAPHQIAISASPTSLIANGVSASAVVIALRDEFGNAIPNHVVSFSTTLGKIDGSATTDGEGKATVTLTSAVTSGIATVTASAGSVSGNATVAFEAGSPSKLALAVNPPQVVADGTSTITVEASIADAFDNPVSGQTVAFAATMGVIPSSAATNALGKATVLLTAPKTRGLAAVTASLGGMSKTLQMNFVAGAPALVTVSATPSHIAADGESTSTIAVIVADTNGNRADGREVKFSTTRGSIQPTGVTNVDGVATAILTSDVAAGVAVITAEAGQASGQTSVTMSSPTALPVTEEPRAATAYPHIYLPLVAK